VGCMWRYVSYRGLLQACWLHPLTDSCNNIGGWCRHAVGGEQEWHCTAGLLRAQCLRQHRTKCNRCVLWPWSGASRVMWQCAFSLCSGYQNPTVSDTVTVSQAHNVCLASQGSKQAKFHYPLMRTLRYQACRCAEYRDAAVTAQWRTVRSTHCTI
jgi:hypothetical protein